MTTVHAQKPDAPVPAPARGQFFAGTVTELDEQHIRVSRNLVGHPPEARSFAITAETKVNRSAIKVKARVTVRYHHLEIQLRPSTHPPRPS
jgi:hypothetical protein